ncbi:MAG: M14 family zinc carboxypeptidase [Acidobacteriota bacterium]
MMFSLSRLARAGRLALLGALLASASATAQDPSTTAPADALAPTRDGVGLFDALDLDPARLDPTMPSPAAFLGRPIGADFTEPARIVDYFETLAAASPRVALTRYGTSYTGRPLLVATITAAANHARIDAIRDAHRSRIDGARAEAAADPPAIVWLGYTIHGNESSCAETAMLTAWLLAAHPDAAALDNVVVLLDPLLNPDGYARYEAAYRARRGRAVDAWPDAWEHAEPWPGGRQNHYLHDLNRDWAWLSQQESRARIAQLRRWEPHVVVDFHEMSPPAPYFFPPAADPVHAEIPPAVLDGHRRFGEANAARFDRLGWSFFVRESYDLFYPSYGDTYPSLRGAVGMTYEVAGGWRAGLEMTLPDGRTWRLADRIVRHATTGITTVRTAVADRAQLDRGLRETRRAAQERPVTTFLWAAETPEADALAGLLRDHGIVVGRLRTPQRLALRPHAATNGGTVRRALGPGTYAVATDQPLGALVRALMDRESVLDADFFEAQRARVAQRQRPAFYDITAWSLPLAYNVATWVHDGRVADVAPLPARPIDPSPRVDRRDPTDPPPLGSGPDTPVGYAPAAWLVPPQGLRGYRLLAEARRAGLPLRRLTAGVTLPTIHEAADRHVPPGTIVVARVDAAGEPTGPRLRALASSVGARVVAFDGAALDGVNARGLGTERAVWLPPRVRVGLVAGRGVRSTAHGALWHVLDAALVWPDLHRIDVDRLRAIDLRRLDVLLLPDGDYDATLDERAVGALRAWVESGGVLVVSERAGAWARENELSRLETRARHGAADGAADRGPADRGPAEHRPMVPGAIVATRIVADHPLAAGLPAPPPTLVRGRTFLRPSGDPATDVLVVRESDPVLAGVVWPASRGPLAGSLLVAREARGRGAVVTFAQAPVFRSFWRGTAPLLLNVLLAPAP